jgi:hypothetical protein
MLRARVAERAGFIIELTRSLPFQLLVNLLLYHRKEFELSDLSVVGQDSSW